MVGAALYAAFAEGRELDDADLVRAIEETVPLYDTYEERIKELRDWARGRARPASLDATHRRALPDPRDALDCVAMPEPEIRRERAQNLWASFARKFEPVAQATSLEPLPDFELVAHRRARRRQGGDPDLRVRRHRARDLRALGHAPALRHAADRRRAASASACWPRALATLTRTSFLCVAVPRLVLEVIHRGGKVGELVAGWSETMQEMPPLTVLFNELEFSQAEEIGARRPDLPVGPVMDFLLDLLDRTIAVPSALVVGATSHPDTLRRAFVQPGRLERIVECTPVFPDDIVATLRIHAEAAEKRAGHALFERGRLERGGRRLPRARAGRLGAHPARDAAPQGALRGGRASASPPVTTADLLAEVARCKQAASRLAIPKPGTYV